MLMISLIGVKDLMVKAWKKLGGTISTIEVTDTNATEFNHG